MNSRPNDDWDARLKDLSERYGFHLARWAHGKTPVWARGSFDLQELVHETLAAVAQDAGGEGPCSDRTLLARVRLALHANLVTRVQSARLSLTGPIPQASPTSPSHSAERILDTDLLERYETALRQLGPLDQQAIIARAELGLPWSEITELLHKTGVAAARMTVSRALVRLAREMSHDR